MDWFVGLLLGHLMGDYVFQSSWMALNKKEYFSIACLHCLIYTMCVCIGLSAFGVVINPLLCCFIFLSHIILDFTNLVEKWMRFYGISFFTDCVQTKKSLEGRKELYWEGCMNAAQVVQTAFYVFVYIAVDNTLHLVMMTAFLKYFLLV